MKSFRDADVIKSCITENKTIPVGQIIGHVTAVKEKIGTTPDGSQKISWVALGEFEAVVYKTGEVITSGAIYLPNYYALELQAAIGTGATQDGNVLFGVEVSVAPTGKMIPYAWEVQNITGMARSKPLEQLKRFLSQKGLLRLPAPVTLDQAAIAAPVPSQASLEVEGEADEIGEADGDVEGTEVASNVEGAEVASEVDTTKATKRGKQTA
jgi:hypothetical protein